MTFFTIEKNNRYFLYLEREVCINFLTFLYPQKLLINLKTWRKILWKKIFFTFFGVEKSLKISTYLHLNISKYKNKAKVFFHHKNLHGEIRRKKQLFHYIYFFGVGRWEGISPPKKFNG